MARPKKVHSERLTRRVKFDIFLSDYAKTLEAAEKAGMALASYSPSVMSPRQGYYPQNRKLNHDIFDEIRCIGINFN